MSSPILKSIRYDEIIVGYTNWWLKARFRSVFSSGKIVRTVSGTRRSGIGSIFDLDLTLKKSCMRCQDLKNYKNEDVGATRSISLTGADCERFLFMSSAGLGGESCLDSRRL